MALIYENSHVTISVNNAAGALLSQPAMGKINSAELEVAESDGTAYNIIMRPPLDHELSFARTLETVGDSD